MRCVRGSRIVLHSDSTERTTVEILDGEGAEGSIKARNISKAVMSGYGWQSSDINIPRSLKKMELIGA
jgi:hypothetical protein